MTDLSSNDNKEEVADIAAELISEKINAARRDTQQTHLLRIGPFHMEIVPNPDLDVEEFFTQTYKYICEEYKDNKAFWNASEMGNKHYQ